MKKILIFLFSVVLFIIISITIPRYMTLRLTPSRVEGRMILCQYKNKVYYLDVMDHVMYPYCCGIIYELNIENKRIKKISGNYCSNIKTFNNDIYYINYKNNYIYKLKLKNNKIQKIINTSVEKFSISDGELYYIDCHNTLHITNLIRHTNNSIKIPNKYHMDKNADVISNGNSVFIKNGNGKALELSLDKNKMCEINIGIDNFIGIYKNYLIYVYYNGTSNKNNRELCKLNISNRKKKIIYRFDSLNNNMISLKSNYVYFIYDERIYKINVLDSKITKLWDIDTSAINTVDTGVVIGSNEKKFYYMSSDQRKLYMLEINGTEYFNKSISIDY